MPQQAWSSSTVSAGPRERLVDFHLEAQACPGGRSCVRDRAAHWGPSENQVQGCARGLGQQELQDGDSRVGDKDTHARSTHCDVTAVPTPQKPLRPASLSHFEHISQFPELQRQKHRAARAQQLTQHRPREDGPPATDLVQRSTAGWERKSTAGSGFPKHRRS